MARPRGIAVTFALLVLVLALGFLRNELTNLIDAFAGLPESPLEFDRQRSTVEQEHLALARGGHPRRG